MGILEYLQEKRFRYVSLLIIFILMIIRQCNRLQYQTLWAEDGTIFLSKTLTYGYKSIFMPYMGYLQSFPQIISLMSYHFTLTHYPIMTLFICTFIYAYTMSSITSSSYSCINENHIVRFFIALSLTCIPGTPEILGNLANLHTVLFIFVTLRVIANFNEKYSSLDYILFLLTACSSGEFFLIFPVVLYRIFILYNTKDKSIQLSQNVLILLIIVLSLAVNYVVFLKSELGINKNIHDYVILIWEYLPKFVLTVLNRTIYLPFLGNLTILLNHNPSIAIILGTSIILFICLISVQKKMHDRYFILLIIVLFSQMFEILLTVCVRYNAANTSFMGQLNSSGDLSIRYLIMMTPFVLIFWQVFINKLLIKLNLNKRLINITLIVLSLYTIVLNSDRIIFKNFYAQFGSNIYANEYFWPYNVQLIYNTINYAKPEELTIPIAPFGWYLTITHSQLKNMGN